MLFRRSASAPGGVRMQPLVTYCSLPLRNTCTTPKPVTREPGSMPSTRITRPDAPGSCHAPFAAGTVECVSRTREGARHGERASNSGPRNAAASRRHLVWKFRIRVNVLHVVEILQHLEELEQALRVFALDRYRRRRPLNQLAAVRFKTRALQALAYLM